ncbi:MAG: TonB-dependent receptor domain-containing protein [Candidatus Acidiferrales bacterium]
MTLNKAKWSYLFATCVLSLALGLGTLAQDQSSARGNFSGVVLDATKAVVPGAQVTITGPMGSLSQTTKEEGTFLFSTLIPGFYSVKVQKEGFRVASITSVEVLINKTTSIEVALETGQLSQTVEVSAAVVTVDPTAASVNADFSDSFYEKIPLGRGVSSLFYLAPGVVSGGGTGAENPSISGSSGLENLYVADGVSINDPAFGGIGVWSRAYGPLGTGINLSFVKEVQIKTGGFEPQYGHVSGGIIQLVTKSGGNKFFGTIGGYINTRMMQTNYENADDPKFGVTNLVGSRLNNANYEGDFQLGGYVPVHGLRDRLFFFGTFNPSWNHAYFAPAINSGLFTIYKGLVDRTTTRYDYAGKLTFKINSLHTIESTISADPSSTNDAPYATLTANDKTANSSWNYGTRNWSVRYDGTFGSSFLVDGAFTWSWNHFSEKPLFDITQVFDNTQIYGLTGQRGAFNAQGFGFSEPYDSQTKSLQGSVSKTFHLFGNQHTLSGGYTWQFPSYNDIISESGGRFTVPQLNATGGDPGYDTATNPSVAGKSADATLSLSLAGLFAPGADGNFDPVLNPNDTTCTLCPLMNVPGYDTPVRVVLQQTRGRFDAGVTKSTGKYHAAFFNDAWEMGKHVTLNLGLRWEQQRLIGNQVSKVFNDMWSPRIGVIVDPQGNRKSKFYANYGRYAFILPLDAALRALSSEDDFQNAYWAPASDASGNVVLDAQNSVTFQPDAAHLLNLATGGIPVAAGKLVSGGEPFAPGTRMEYTDEFVVGYDREFRGGIVASVRYIDRRLKRVIEDQGGISVEQFNALAANGGGLNYFIGNPNAAQDIFVNPNEQVFGGVNESPVTCNEIDGPTPGVGTFDCAIYQAIHFPSALNAAAAEALGLPSACVDSNNIPTPYIASNQFTGIGAITPGSAPVGSACFPAVNTGTWTNASTGKLLPDCASLAQSKAGGCAAFGGEFYGDGKADTYKDPKREYEAVEFEVTKSFSHNWALSVNYRLAQLRGNYEGAFRNDNGQADPGISSLFDLTEGKLGLLANQQSIGFLNGDRKHVLNMHASYVLPNGMLKGLVLGTGLKVQSGIPLTTLVAQQAYQNPGEVPIFGRGDLGRTPVTGTVDAHVEYPIRITERMHLKLGFDLFNIGNTKRLTSLDQNLDLGFGLLNGDFKRPVTSATFQTQGFVDPFTSRLSIRLEF